MNKEILEILACPACKKKVIFKNDEIICLNCSRAYPIKDGIPVMLIEEARKYENKQKG
ncbi:MAG: Trm112 family protein [Candidatus Omnitrophica bacterium]|nr:Trm112 family protein [Candidatus Omnitrophota bacterium]MDD5429750.1 Trm112 family protein [Candidatus Omnitrophota bacterium]